MNQAHNFATLVQVACSRVGVSTYRLRAAPELVPDVVDCSSFLRWCYRQIGIVLPRYSWEQHSICIVISKGELCVGDIVFMKPKTKPHPDRPIKTKVGHVCLYIGNGQVIHAASPALGVVIVPLTELDPERIVSFGRPDFSRLKRVAA